MTNTRLIQVRSYADFDIPEDVTICATSDCANVHNIIDELNRWALTLGPVELDTKITLVPGTDNYQTLKNQLSPYMNSDILEAFMQQLTYVISGITAYVAPDVFSLTNVFSLTI